jgi:hypothetical protein
MVLISSKISNCIVENVLINNKLCDEWETRTQKNGMAWLIIWKFGLVKQ